MAKIARTCRQCGTAFLTTRPKASRPTGQEFCSKRCSGTHTAGARDYVGAKNPNWKSGEVALADGRIAIYCPGHPEAKLFGGTHALRYRVVATEKLGRPLRPGEIVHHLNGIKSDDRSENLHVMYQPDHARAHSAERARDVKTGRLLPDQKAGTA